MAEREQVVCQDCGAGMNLHAEKIDYAREPGEGEGFAEVLGGAVEEFHTCPECGRAEARPAG